MLTACRQVLAWVVGKEGDDFESNAERFSHELVSFLASYNCTQHKRKQRMDNSK